MQFSRRVNFDNEYVLVILIRFVVVVVMQAYKNHACVSKHLANILWFGRKINV
jgi:hypothetical protein